MNIKFDSKRVLIVSAFLLFLVIVGSGLAADRRTDAQATTEKPGIAMQFVGSFTCIFTECGWPAIVILVLPAIAVYVWKKVFSWG